jgi:long-chain acyl-CoA synthetase
MSDNSSRLAGSALPRRIREVLALDPGATTLVSPVSEKELMDYLASRLTRYQRPVAIKVVDHLPRTPSLKISRALVREHCFGDPGPREPGGAPGTATSGDPHDR